MSLSIDYKIYEEDTRRLVHTMIIHSKQNAEIINQRMLEGGFPYNPSDKKTWKYYMNLAGVYHPTNEMMRVKSLDTGEIIDFTVENLTRHVSTWRSYQYGTDYYLDLVRKYSYQTSLINGVLNPIPFEESTEAPDFKILYHDSSLVEDGEDGLMNEVQDWIYTMDWQWYHRDYATITEDLYHQYHMGVLHIMLIGVILGIRIKNTDTNKAHSFHIWSHILSHADLEAYRPYFNRKQILWLYRNIIYVKCNAGKRYTFEKLIENMLTERRVPIGSFDAVHNTEELLENFSPRIEFKRTMLNMQNSTADRTYVKSTDSILEAEIPLAKNNKDIYKEEIVNTDRAMSSTMRNEIPTKVLESKMRDRSDSVRFPMAETLINEWAHMTDRGLYASIITITNPSTGLKMTMSVKDAFVLYLYAVWKAKGVTLDIIPAWNATTVVRLPRPSFYDLKKQFGCQYLEDNLIREALLDLPYIERIISTERFYMLAKAINDKQQIHRDLYCYRPHMDVRAHTEKMVLALYQDRLCDFYENKRYKDLFDEKGWRFGDLPKDEWLTFATAIMTVGTGLDTANIQRLVDIQRAMIDATLKLSSYTIHVIREINTEAIHMLDTTYHRVGDQSAKIKLHGDSNKTDVRVLNQRAKPSRRALDVVCSHRFSIGRPFPNAKGFVDRPIGVMETSGVKFHQYVAAIHQRVWDKPETESINYLDKDIKHKALDGLSATREEEPEVVIEVPVLDGLTTEPLESLDVTQPVLDGLETDPAESSLDDIRDKLLKGLNNDMYEDY